MVSHGAGTIDDYVCTKQMRIHSNTQINRNAQETNAGRQKIGARASKCMMWDNQTQSEMMYMK